MAHDVFISYSTQDKAVADAVCATLESSKIRCWIAPRDVVPGVPYAEALIEALNRSKVLVLVFSSSSNKSPQVMREVERAVNKGVAIIPFRIENVMPSRSMEYYLSVPHWLDALTPPLEKHLQKLTDTIQALLAGIDKPAPDEEKKEYAEKPFVEIKSRKKSRLLIPVVAAIVLVIAVGLFFMFSKVWKQDTTGETIPPASTTPALQVLFEDDFSESGTGWTSRSDDVVEAGYAEGEFYLLVKEAHVSSQFWNVMAGRPADFSMDIDARLVDGPDKSGYGITFRLQDRDNYYGFYVFEQGCYFAEKHVNGEVITLQPLTESDFIEQGKGTNHFKVVCNGSQIEVYINGNHLTTINDSSFTEGYIGLVARCPDTGANTRVAFDNFQISGTRQIDSTTVPTTAPTTVSTSVKATVSETAATSAVSFPDSRLDSIIRQTINKPTGPILPSDLESITRLSAPGENIVDLTGIEKCVNLETLYLYGNGISDIKPLAQLTNLHELKIYQNKITDISPLAGLVNLEELWLGRNGITDISSLGKLTNLRLLVLIYNNILDISPLVENSGLSDGDIVDLTGNSLDSTSINDYIPQLESRGVNVMHD